ncbi:MAG: MFS transporter [Chloroflexi bacterium]|nr:MFS transporter [Chloroflexota bacterium]
MPMWRLSRPGDRPRPGRLVNQPAIDETVSRRQRALLFVVAAGVFVAADDQTSIVAVLPPLINDIGLTVDDFYRASWVVNGYLLGYLIALPIMGRVADVYGHARVFAVALGIFMFGSALVALSPSFTPLVLARAIQAVGGGGVVPVAMAIVVSELPRERRLLGLGAIAAASEFGALIGPLWGGSIAELWGWRLVFWINLPMTLPLALAALRLAGSERQRGSIDWGGAALLGASLTALTFALVDDPNEPRAWVWTASLVALAVGLAGAFFWHERRVDEPMAPLQALSQRAVIAANLTHFAVGVGLITVLIGVPLFVNLVLVEGALDGGLTLMRLTIAVPVGALAGAWLGGRIGLQVTTIVGCLLAAIFFLGLQAWDGDLTEVMRTVPQLVGGFGFGLTIAPLGAAVLQRVSERDRAAASGWLTLSRVAGMLVGAAVLTSTGLGRFYARAGTVEFDSPEFASLVAEAQVQTFHEVFLAGAVVMLIAAALAWAIGRGHRDADIEPWWTIT